MSLLRLLESNYNILETFPKYQIEDENLMVSSFANIIEVIKVTSTLLENLNSLLTYTSFSLSKAKILP